MRRSKARAAALDPARSWHDQLADLADRHPSPDDYYTAFPRVWNAARTAAIDAELVTWPDFPIDYVPIPASDREAARRSLLPSLPLSAAIRPAGDASLSRAASCS